MGVRTLFLVVSILAASTLDAAAVELINPHDVLNQTRRGLNEFDKRMERDKAEQQKEEKARKARQKQEEAEKQKREKAEKALQEAQRKRDVAEQQKRATEEKALQEAQRKREAAEQQKQAREERARQEAQEAERQKREKAEQALQEERRKREVAEQQARQEKARQQAQEAERQKREEAEKAQEAQRKREAAATKAAEGASPVSPTTTPSQPATGRAGSKFEEDPTVTASVHAAAPHHLPWFFAAPGETDGLMVGVAVFLVIAVVTVGILFLRLHTLPERIAHRSHKLQFEIVAVLGLLALFTHVHLFWVVGLLLAMIDLPDFGWPLRRIAGAAEMMAGMKPGEGAAHEPDEAVNGSAPSAVPINAPAETRVQPREKELTLT